MAAYEVIGGAIGGAIAIAITPFLRKRIKDSNKKKDKKNQEQKSYKPGATWFGFICAIGSIVVGVFGIWWMINNDTLFNYLLLLFHLFMLLFGVLFGCWTGSYLGARITVLKEGLIIDHAAKMSNKEKSKIQMTQLGCHHLDLRWEEIRELRADINHMKIILQNGDVYSFPIGWCKEEARAAIARHKQIKPWE